MGVQVYFDVETTGLNTRFSQIVSIGAVCGAQQTRIYIYPTCPIPESASNIHGITQVMPPNILALNGQTIQAFTPEQGLQEFLRFLLLVSGGMGQVVLVAHNCARFDSVVLVENFRRVGLSGRGIIAGFLDTLELARKAVMPPHHPHRNFKLTTLMRTFLGQEQGHKHDALQDAVDLRSLVERMALFNGQTDVGIFFSQFCQIIPYVD